jgi:hypothetical protein
MPSSFDIEQTDRLLNVTSPLGVDQLILTAFTGTEQLSGLFTFDLELVSPEQEIDPTLILGKPIGWSVKKPGGGRRPFQPRLPLVSRRHLPGLLDADPHRQLPDLSAEIRARHHPRGAGRLSRRHPRLLRHHRHASGARILRAVP